MTNRQIRRKNLGRLLRPRHIAFIGGSQAAGAIDACRRAGYAGQIWTVNPRRESIGGIRCVPRIDQLPEPPDAALLALSPQRTIQALRELNAAGAGGAVCMAAGFAELGDAGKALQAELVAAAGDMAVLGPNCMGMLNQFDGAAVWASENHIERVEGNGAAFISQSGAMVFGVSNVERVYQMGYGISTGNQAVCDAADCIHAVLDDPRIKAIGLYIEGIDDGNELGGACQRALDQGVPIVVLKGGDTAAGESVAISHTGAMVVGRDIWNAFAERYGLVEVFSPKELMETLKLLSVIGLNAGPRMSITTFSGGMNGIIAAQAPRYGIELPPPTPANAARLRARMPEGVPIANPLDLNLPWQSKTGMSMQDGDEIAEGLVELADGSADMAALILDVPRRDDKRIDKDWLPTVYAMMHVRKTLGLPTIVGSIMPEGFDISLRRELLDAGIAPLLGYRETMEACSAAIKLAKIHAEKRPDGAAPPLLLRHTASAAPAMLDEAASKALLEPYSLAMPKRWAGSAADAAAAADAIGYPVAVKVLSNTIAHKAKAGGVRLGLGSHDDVAAAIDEMTVALAEHGYSAEHFLVECMVERPIAEYIIGVKRDRAMGLALMIGVGGVAVEQTRRYATVLLPLHGDALDKAFAAIGVLPNTLGYTGLQAAAHAVAAFATDHSDQLEALDVNPVIVTAAGDAVAADALIVMA